MYLCNHLLCTQSRKTTAITTMFMKHCTMILSLPVLCAIMPTTGIPSAPPYSPSNTA